jgi:glucokinase
MVSIGVDIGATKTVIATLSDDGELHTIYKVPSAKMLREKGNAVDSLDFFLNEYIQMAGYQKELVRGIGIGAPAVLNKNTQEIVNCPNLPELDNLPLSVLLAPKMEIPIYVENDVNLIALGEHSFGRGQGIDNLACVYVGTGIGCGLILQGQLYTGADGAAAEFGHMIYEADGRLCGCGTRGCYEAYCSGRALTAMASEIFSKSELDENSPNREFAPWTSAEKVIRAAKAGNSLARDVLEKSFSILGIAVTNMANLINPKLIILGGGIITGWPEGLNTVRQVVKSKARSVVRDSLVIDFPTLWEKAGLYGAAQLVNLSEAD